VPFLEVDVATTRDGVLVLMHDDTLDRTTDGAGPVAVRDAAELRSLDAGIWFGNEFAGERVPTFEAAAALCRGLGLWANVEIKPDGDNAEDTGRIVSGLAARFWKDASPAPLLSSFSEPALAAARREAPDLPRALLVEEIPADWRRRVEALGCRALHCQHEKLTRALVEELHEAGLGVAAYTVNDPGRAIALFDMGVDAVVTDELRDIRPDFLASHGFGP